MSRAVHRYSRILCAIFRPIDPRAKPCLSPKFAPIRRISSVVPAAELRFGQPLHETHPHLLEAGEGRLDLFVGKDRQLTGAHAVTPGISALEYVQRRTKLAGHLPDNAIAVVAASETVYRTGHVFYDFHQDPDFFYLTGGSTLSKKRDSRLKAVAQVSMNPRLWL